MGRIILLAVVLGLLVSGCVTVTTAFLPYQRDLSATCVPRLGANDGSSIDY